MTRDTADTAELLRRVADLEARLAAMEATGRMQAQHGPRPPIFPARRVGGSARKWRELVVESDGVGGVDLVDHAAPDARQCANDADDERALDLYGDEFFLVEVLEGDAARYVRIGGSSVRWCKVTGLNACDNSFNANPCNEAGGDTDTGTELVVYTHAPTNGECGPDFLCLPVGAVVPYVTSGEVNVLVAKRQLISFGNTCSTNHGSVAGLQFLSLDFLLTTGVNQYGTACAGVEPGQVELRGNRYSVYPHTSDSIAKVLQFGSGAGAVGDTNNAHFVSFQLASTTVERTDTYCGPQTLASVVLDAMVPATMIEGWDSGCGTNAGKLLRLKLTDKFKLTDNGSGVWELDIRTEDKDVVVDPITCADGSITYSTARVHSVIGCGSGGA